MTSTEQRDKLQRQIWQIANEVRGAVDGWDFKQYVLGTLFYRFISENFASHMEGGDDSIHYAKLPDSIITAGIKDDAIRTKGYFIYPSQLFANVVAQANINQNLNTDLAAIFSAIESSATGISLGTGYQGVVRRFRYDQQPPWQHRSRKKRQALPPCSKASPTSISATSRAIISTCSAMPMNS